MMDRIGIIIEYQNGTIKESNWGMITLARRWNFDLYAIVLNADCEKLKEKFSSYGVVNIIEVQLEDNDENNPDIRAKAIITTINDFDITSVLGLSTTLGKDLLPRIASSLEAPLVMDCIDVDLAGKSAKTSRYSGKTLATIQVTGKFFVFGVMPNVTKPEKHHVESKFFYCTVAKIETKGIRRIENRETNESQKINLKEAEVIVAGGRGLKNGQNFDMLSMVNPSNFYGIDIK